MKNIIISYTLFSSALLFSAEKYLPFVAKLPPILQQKIQDAGVSVKSKSKNNKKSLFSDTCQEYIEGNYIKLAKYNKGKKQIVLDSQVFEAVQNKNNETCLQSTKFEIAKKIIIEQYAIAFDHLNIKLGVEKSFADECEESKEIVYRRKLGPQKSSVRVPKEVYTKSCREFMKHKRSVSKSPYFQTLSGWVDHGIIFQRKKNHNQFNSRSPLSLEWRNPERSFSVNFASYILDHEFKCRKPSVHRYFNRVFDFKPQGECQLNYLGKMSPKLSPIEQKPANSDWVDLNPKRLYQVHYLFAGTGEQLMSKWGHSMFRLVYCRPGRPIGPECLKDIGYDIVLSYRANVDDTQIDYFKGMFGGYESRLYLESLIDVINEYNKGEYREVTSLPINLTREEKNIFIERTLEQFWSYRGKYYFVTQNCAHEAMSLLRVAKQDHLHIQTKDILTPLGMNHDLIQMDVFDDSVLEDKDWATNKTYFFPSHAIRLKEAIEHLKGEGILLTELKWDEYFDLPVETKRSFWKQAKNEKDIAKLIFLEEQSILLQQQGIAKNIGKLLAKHKNLQLQAIMQVGEIQKRYEQLIPQNHLGKGYGIPVENENQGIFDNMEQIEVSQITESRESLRDMLKVLMPSEVTVYEATQEGRKYLLKKFAETLFGLNGQAE